MPKSVILLLNNSFYAKEICRYISHVQLRLVENLPLQTNLNQLIIINSTKYILTINLVFTYIKNKNNII